MKARRLAPALLVCLGLALWATAAVAEDVTNAKNYPLFSRMPRFHITQSEYNFDAVEFPTGPESATILEGRRLYLGILAGRWLAAAQEFNRSYATTAMP